MKQIRWMIPAAAMVVAACSDQQSLTSPNVTPQHAVVVTCPPDEYCGPQFQSLDMVSDTSPPAPTKVRTIDLASTHYVGVLMRVPAASADQIGKTTFWSGVVSDTSPPAPAPPSPNMSLIAKMGRATFLKMLNNASITAGGGVGPAPSDTSPPSPGPVGAIWRNADSQTATVLLIASIDDMQKFGTIRKGDGALNMRIEMMGGAKKALTQYSSLGGVSIIGPEKTMTSGK